MQLGQDLISNSACLAPLLGDVYMYMRFMAWFLLVNFIFYILGIVGVM